MKPLLKTIGYYKIEYTYLTVPVIQFKYLIKNEDYLTIIKPTNSKIYELSLIKKENKNYDKAQIEIKSLKTELLSNFGKYYFTDYSYLFDAINSGYLKNQFEGIKTYYGKKEYYKVKITKIT